MSIAREHVVHCDYGPCRDMIRLSVPTLTEARKQARRKGWRTKRTLRYDGVNVVKDYCPRHATVGQ